MSQQLPAIPIVTHDPYFSYWLMADELHGDCIRHWTGSRAGLVGLIRIDGNTYRFLGHAPFDMAKMPQSWVEVTATKSKFSFSAEEVELTVEFLSPLLLDDVALCSRPATYVRFEVTTASPKDVQIYFDAGAELAVDKPSDKVVWSRFSIPNLNVIRVGSARQPTLERSGDDLRIDWGHLYLAADSATSTAWLGEGEVARASFSSTGKLPIRDDLGMPRKAEDRWVCLTSAFDLGTIKGTSSRYLILAYDDEFSVEYLDRRLRPYWRFNGRDASDLLVICNKEYESVRDRCREFDTKIAAELRRRGGIGFEKIGVICYRQSIAAHKIVADFDGRVLMFSKENFSNGCMGTVDVTYPSSPLFFLLNPALLDAQIIPVLEYASTTRWKFPFAPHDLGTYPLANGQVYGGGESSERDQMPVEECGNMLILLAASAHYSGNPDLAVRYWPLLKQWAEYLTEKGEAPERQLCTDDFTNRIANNTNLSVKAILGVGGFAQLCGFTGHEEEQKLYRAKAEAMAADWVERATEGDHTRLAFDVSDTWSTKYNLVWDRLLGLNLFPAKLAGEEIAFYQRKQLTYGLPLDCREKFTKIDWALWVASFLDDPKEFAEFIAPIDRWLSETPTRVPVTDLYWADDGRQVGWDRSRVGISNTKGFQARSVVGGVFLPLLT